MASGKWNYNVPATGPSASPSLPPPTAAGFGASSYYSLVMAAIGGGVVICFLLIGVLMRRMIRRRLSLNLERRGLGARGSVDAEWNMPYPGTGERGEEASNDMGEETTVKVNIVTR